MELTGKLSGINPFIWLTNEFTVVIEVVQGHNKQKRKKVEAERFAKMPIKCIAMKSR